MSGKAIMSNANNGAEKRLDRTKRQAILMRIVESSDKELTFEEIAAKMRDDPWVASRWPAYSASTANKDFSKVMTLVEDDVRAMALPYLAHHINLADDAIKTLHGFSRDDDLDYKTRIDSLNAMLKYLDQSHKIFGSYAAKEMNIKKAELSVTLDDFMALSRQANRQLDDDDNVVDGDFLVKDDSS